MPHITFTTRSEEGLGLEADLHRTSMEPIGDGVVGKLSALSVGACSSATCHDHIDHPYSGRLALISDDEDSLLSGSAYRKSGSRPVRQIRLVEALECMHLTIAPED